jgi:hypothetical protein
LPTRSTLGSGVIGCGSDTEEPAVDDGALNLESTHISRLARRQFVTRAAIVAGLGTIAPFSFVRRATAGPNQLEGLVRQKMHE